MLQFPCLKCYCTVLLAERTTKGRDSCLSLVWMKPLRVAFQFKKKKTRL